MLTNRVWSKVVGYLAPTIEATIGIRGRPHSFRQKISTTTKTCRFSPKLTQCCCQSRQFWLLARRRANYFCSRPDVDSERRHRSPKTHRTLHVRTLSISISKLNCLLTSSAEVTKGTCFNPNDNQNYEVDFFIGASLNSSLTGYEVPSSMNDADLLVSFANILYLSLSRNIYHSQGEFGVPEFKWHIPTYHVRASRSYIERSSSIVSLFRELENIRIDAWFLSR
jgi:hypothetical protein